jgi:ribose transport system ATP-binding protein
MTQPSDFEASGAMTQPSDLESPLSSKTVLQLRGVKKSYPGVLALRGIDLDFKSHWITAIVGENGAGKSTLIKIISGAVSLDDGIIKLDGVRLPAEPRGVIAAGVSVIYQELTDVPDMTVMENLLLGRMPSRKGIVLHSRAIDLAKEALARVGLSGLALDRNLTELPVHQRQLIEIARCIARDAKVLVLDEPTSSLQQREKDQLMEVIRGLRDQGLVVVYVSHHIDEVMSLADEIVVMRDGAVIETKATQEWTQSSLVRAMLSRELEHALQWRPRELGPVVLQVRELHAPGVADINLSLREGEIVGLLGLAGAGRTEAMKAIAGVSRTDSGSVVVRDEEMRRGSIPKAQEAGIVYVPEDRKKEGLVLEASITNNLTYGLYQLVSRAGWILRGRQGDIVKRSLKEFAVKSSSPAQKIAGLSGGNQQKVILARASLKQPKVLLLDDPTRGVDVGAQATIHEYVMKLAEAGAGILITSSETSEILALADRVYVFRLGRIVGEIVREQFDRATMLQLATAG